jgi:uncharacterized protein YpmB
VRDELYVTRKNIHTKGDFKMTTKPGFYIIGVLLIIMISGLGAGCVQSDQKQFETRRKTALRVASNQDRVEFYTAAAKISMKTDKTNAFDILDSLSRDTSIGGMFYAFQLIGTYLFLENDLPDSLKVKMRNAFRDREMYRGDTENHWVMYYTGIYLASQTWPELDGTDWFNGKTSSDNFAEAEEWLTHWITITTTIGQGEFDSPTYFTTFIAPMVVLYEFAREPVMKTRAQMMLDYLFADFAAEHLKGNYGGGHSRDYSADIINPLSAPSTWWAWLYFGEPDFEPWNYPMRESWHASWDIIFGALSTYRLPEVILGIATDRSEPYVHKETKRTRNIIRFGNERNEPVYKYTYMTEDYVLGSLHGGILQPIQQHTWDITFVSDKPNNTIFTLHPYYSGKELAMFFPEQIKFLADEVDRYHKVYADPNKWNASSPYEQTFQHENTIIVLYDLAEDAKHPHIDGFFPKNPDDLVISADGWIYCKSGNTYVAFYPFKEYEWIEEDVNYRLRSRTRRNGLVLEAGRKKDFGSFDAFINCFSGRIPDIEETSSSIRATYTACSGDTLSFEFDGRRIVNGNEVRLETYGLFSGPYLNSNVGSGVLEILYGRKKRVLDFNTPTITEGEI